ncbi:MAG: DUF2298 domain-containing protein [Anaerolineales bacterium]
MIFAVIAWWAASTLIALIVLPIVWRIFPRLPDRGFGFVHAFGIMAASYMLWIAANFGLLPNTFGGAVFVLVLLALLSVLISHRQLREIQHWLQDNRKTVIIMEVLFLAAFLFWAFVRSTMPDLDHTEKPMELAFLNGILRSETFPPLDPWLSGYAISYYYFGYIQIAFLAKLTSVVGSVSFNIANALWFAMSVVGTFSILFNLLSRRDGRPRFGPSFLGPVFVLITGNLEGFLEVLHARGLFWRQTLAGTLESPFWSWLNIKQLVDAPAADPSWLPQRFWWWWRASRVVTDVNLVGVQNEMIDEFPFFSFLLADNHPHLLALPFVLLAVTLTLHIFFFGKQDAAHLRAERPSTNVENVINLGLFIFLLFVIARSIVDSVTPGMDFGAVVIVMIKSSIVPTIGVFLIWTLFRVLSGVEKSALTAVEFWISAWIFGGVIFLNTWDSPIYLTLLALCIIWRLRGLARIEMLKHTFNTLVAVATAAVLLYFPWYPTFSSQLGGVLPNLVFPTRFPQFLVMFGPLLLPILWWLVLKLRDHWQGIDRRLILIVTIGLPLGLLLLSWLFTWGVILPVISQQELDVSLAGLGAETVHQVFEAALSRLGTGWTALGVSLLIGMGTALLVQRFRSREESERDDNPTWVFIAMLIIIGALLVLGPEFFYLRDQFGYRMNTIFKFYFAAWILWGLAAAYAVSEIWRWGWRLITALAALLPTAPIFLNLYDELSANGLEGKTAGIAAVVLGLYVLAWLVWLIYLGKAMLLAKSGRSLLRRGLTAMVLLPLFLGLLYPYLTLWTKTDHFHPADGYTLDGANFIERGNLPDYQAIQWIRENLPMGVISEAVGGSYNPHYARVATNTGLPTVLGWPGHESQWRGGYEEIGSRKDDIAALYQSRNWEDAQLILDRYGIDYVYVGSAERANYEYLSEQKFEIHMDLIYNKDDVRIYARKGAMVP